VAGLETTATFDPKTDEFVVNTPTSTATKWWPGELGRFANYALTFAQLIVPDEDGGSNNYGVCPFIINIRDVNTHKHMPGVKTGEMGPKFGYNSKDNGWMVLDNVRIPRENMLQKFIAIERDGSVSIKGDLRVLYSTMMLIRTSLITWTKYYLSRALTVGLRYSIVRRQFKNISGKKDETQLIDYQTQQ
jgi:acyl-CoA oxidase